MACYSVAGGAIKREDTNGKGYLSSFQHIAHQTLPKEIKKESSPVPSSPAIQVCPVNVHQGDSILVKLKYKEGMLCQDSDYMYKIDNDN